MVNVAFSMVEITYLTEGQLFDDTTKKSKTVTQSKV